MSVTVPNRGKSDAEFLKVARELEKETRRRCVNGPKRYTFFGLQELWMTTRRIYREIKKANSIFPGSQHEAQLRRDHLIEARADIEDFNSQIELLLEDNILTPKSTEIISDLAATEDALIKGLMKSDRSRYANLP